MTDPMMTEPDDLDATPDAAIPLEADVADVIDQVLDAGGEDDEYR
jgi:hypothetical protein